jgi:predicted transcriptional regulator
MAHEYYNRKKSKEDPLVAKSFKLPQSVIDGLNRIGAHKQRFATFIVREELTRFVAEELRRLNLDGDERGAAAAATRRKAS